MIFSPQVKFAMQGEMGATVYAFPQQWIAVTDKVRQRLMMSDRSKLKEDNVEIGISHNFNKICG